MHVFAITIGCASLLIWVYLMFAHASFWRADKAFAPAAAPARSPRIAAVIPARDEAAHIAQCVLSLLNIESAHIFVVDDDSADGTTLIATEAAAKAGKSASLTVITGSRLPPGWSGKLWAVQQGVERAQLSHPDYLLLTDADIVHSPEDFARLIAVGESGGYDLASYMVRLHCTTVPERLLIPAFVYFFFSLYPPVSIRNPRSAVAGAAGGCMLVRPEAMRRAGGIEAIKSEIIDDCALARAIKRAGGRVWLGLGEETRSVRPYGTFAEIGRMISRSAFNQLRHSGALLIVAVAGMLLTYVAPVVLLFTGLTLPGLLGLFSFALMSFTYAPMIRYYRLRPWWSVMLPVAAVFYVGATLHSAFKFWFGRGGEWKGRVQDIAHSQ